jgi:hypothetical protein
MKTWSSVPSSTQVATRPAAWTYLWWAAVGALASIGLIALLTIGLLFLVGAAVLVGLGLVLGPVRRGGVVGVVAGLSAAPLALAYLNRGGPGTVCKTVGAVHQCEDLWSPWPLLVVGLAVLLAGVAVCVRDLRQRRTRADLFV